MRAGATAFTVLADVLQHFSPELMRLAHPIVDAQATLRSILHEELGLAPPAGMRGGALLGHD